jgi:hypothetical protein
MIQAVIFVPKAPEGAVLARPVQQPEATRYKNTTPPACTHAHPPFAPHTADALQRLARGGVRALEVSDATAAISAAQVRLLVCVLHVRCFNMPSPRN